MVSVAKWLRHWTVTPVFAGSNPVVHPSKNFFLKNNSLQHNSIYIDIFMNEKICT